LVFSMSYFFHHPELSEVMGVGSSAIDSRFFVFLVVVGGDSEGLVAVMAYDLIDVASGELHHGWKVFGNYNISFRMS
jgi:hypothetical protein